LPETFYHFKFASFKFTLSDPEYSKASYISERNKSWLYCGLSHEQLLNSHCLKDIYLSYSIPHRVKFRAEAVNNLLWSLAECSK